MTNLIATSASYHGYNKLQSDAKATEDMLESVKLILIFLLLNPHRSGVYELSEAEGVQRGTKIVIHLKGECYDYCKEEVIKG